MLFFSFPPLQRSWDLSPDSCISAPIPRPGCCVPSPARTVSVESVAYGGHIRSLVILISNGPRSLHECAPLGVTFLEVELLGHGICAFSRFCQIALHGGREHSQPCWQSPRVPFSTLASSVLCRTFDLCQSALWSLRSLPIYLVENRAWALFSFDSFIRSEVEHLSSAQPWTGSLPHTAEGRRLAHDPLCKIQEWVCVSVPQLLAESLKKERAAGSGYFCPGSHPSCQSWEDLGLWHRLWASSTRAYQTVAPVKFGLPGPPGRDGVCRWGSGQTRRGKVSARFGEGTFGRNE